MHYLDVYIQSVRIKNRVRLQPLADQHIPLLFVSASRKSRLQWPVGTIFKVDLVLVKKEKIKNFYRLRKGQKLERAIEYFDHNLQLQQNESSKLEQT
ncbi:hypothetical protein OKW21_005004 [Catalinimonas alkaloidigena]|uniref:hypothetical protein n=1 Tax=Catalinimonas alkaloidigena TaxID=1075417 RepID=UPI0024064028|nr:hypothetical protein [Catalinimonas alkaloidigena]MDF9799741.1 hypothetical protein [Catalinimonas alkaloidigena]